MHAVAAMQLAAWHAAYRGLLADEFLDALSVEGIAGYHARHFDPQANPNLARSAFLVAEDPATGAIVGMVRGGPTRESSAAGDPVPPDVPRRYATELFAIHVAPGTQKNGVGRALVQAFAAAMMETGAAGGMVLWVLRDNTNARGFYERLGGTMVSESVLTLAGRGYAQVAYGWSRLPNITQT